MIICDTNNLIVAAAGAAQKEFGTSTTIDDIRSYFMTTLLGLRKRFGTEYGTEMVMAFDGRADKLWRRQLFPFYKIRREGKKASSPLDWDQIRACINLFKQEFTDFMPYKVVCLENCEGDDIIAALVRHRHKNRKGDIGSSYDEKTIIVSADGDMMQLQTLQGVDQWSVQHDKYVRSEKPVEDYLVKVIRGDAGDDIPSAISPDDVFMTGTRQKPITQKKLDEWIPVIMEGQIPEDLVNFNRNVALISLFHIPSDVCEQIVDAYEAAPVASKTTMTEYFASNRLGNFMEHLPLF